MDHVKVICVFLFFVAVRNQIDVGTNCSYEKMMGLPQLSFPLIFGRCIHGIVLLY
jgi:hypothetical protein